jgi:hypothetical protein
VTVTVSDGIDAGSDESDGVTVLNTPPTAPGVSIPTPEPCPVGWSQFTDETRCVAAFDRLGLTWDGAQVACEEQGGNLIRIDSTEEAERAASIARDALDYSPGDTVFIGLQAVDDWTGPWAWTDGEPESFSNWIPGEPGDGFRAGDLRCAMAYVASPSGSSSILAGMWNDANCSSFDNLDPSKIPGYVCQQLADASNLVCTIEEESTDHDGDPITYTFDWDVDGTPFTDAETTTYTGDTVAGADIGYSEMWTCEVTPYDDEDDGDLGSAAYTSEALEFTEVFDYTGVDQAWTVPDGVTEVTVKVWAAAGGGSNAEGYTHPGGAGGYVEGLVMVSPGTTLTILVGEGGPISSSGVFNAYPNGGLPGDRGGYGAGGGGGRSAVLEGATQLIVAGAGGGAGGTGHHVPDSTAGGGGGEYGENGDFVGYADAFEDCHGLGATPTTPGPEVVCNGAGSALWTGLAGGFNYGGDGLSFAASMGNTGGGGGDGYYGGSAGAIHSGGGGGSNHTDSALVSDVRHEQSLEATPPNSTDAHYISGVAAGVPAARGGHGLVVISN